MTKREELHRLVRDFRNYVEASGRGLSQAGAVPADPESRRAFEKRLQKRRARKVEALKQSFSEPSQASDKNTESDRAGSPGASATPARSESTQAEPQSETKSAEPLWKQFGSRPKPTYARKTKFKEYPRPWDSDVSDPAVKLDALRRFIGDCERCRLCEQRKKIVFGEGSPSARLMFIGEGPGQDEDRTGRPFVGKAGNLLDKMINAMGLKREDAYIANVVKCRPPNNRDPRPDEVAACAGFLVQQVEIVQPDVIVGLGKFAVNVLLDRDGTLGEVRGKWHEFKGIPVMPTYHPAYLLRNDSMKRPVWQDLQAVMEKL